ncbi:MAG TPA: hypothetical protein VGQ59_15085, partial [Cyclobacteriaceae bacterium]|nr:hypothetical protein [Cyclobacteriaceae bacterium]
MEEITQPNEDFISSNIEESSDFNPAPKKKLSKPIIIALSSIVASIILITQLYEYTDIEIVDKIVETVAKNTGLGTGLVAKKVEEKARKNEEEKKEVVITEPAPVETTQIDEEEEKRKVDSVLFAQELEKEKAKKKKVVFNTVIDSAVAVRPEIPKKDSVAVVEKPKKKKKLFNGSEDE